MSSVATRPGGRTALPALLAVLLAVGMVVDPRLAIIFSPILVLALLVTHPRIESAIVELVHGLASNAATARAVQKLARPRHLVPARSTLNASCLGSRAPPLQTI